MAQGTHKIPQNVTQYEGRIIGNFTAKQFIFLAIGMMADFLLFNTPIPMPIRIALIAVVSVVALIFSLVNVQGKTTDAWISDFLHSVNDPTQRVWRKNEHPPAFLLPNFNVTKIRSDSDKKQHARYELESFIELWSPSSQNTDLTDEEKAHILRIKQNGGLAVTKSDATTKNPSAPAT